MLSAVESCASNNGGVYTNCGTAAQLITAPNNYFNPATVVGGGANYGADAAAATTTKFQVVIGSNCAGVATTGAVAVRVGQEAGAAYCVNN